MRKPQMAVLILLALVSIVIAIVLWPKAFPMASIDFRVRPAGVKTQLARFVEALGHSPNGYHSATSFGEDVDTTRYIELKYGIPRLEQLTKSGLNIWYWNVRWFRPEQHEEFAAALDPQGRIVGFFHTIEEEKAVPSLDGKAARVVAEEFIRKFITNHPLDKLRFISVSSEEKPHRTDYHFTWERDDFRLGEAPYRLGVTVQGNEVGGYNECLKVPEQWLREFAKKRETNNLCMSIASVALTTIGVGFVIILILSIRNRRLRWRDALPWGWFVLFAAIGILAKVNSIPQLLAGYQTTENWNTFIGQNFFSTIRNVLLSLGGFWLLALVADALYREKLPSFPSFRRGLGTEGFRSASTGRSLFVGVIFATVSVAYVSAFYVLGRRWGVWAPVEIDYAKTLSGWFPWVSPIQTGLSAAFGEEMLFRVVGLMVFWKVVRIRWLAILLSSATWAFLHSNYPQMPGYARGIELTIVGIVWSILLLRYGLLTTLTAHYLYDCWLGNMIVFQSASSADRAGALVGSGWPVALLGLNWWLCHRHGSKALPPETADVHPPALPDAADSHPAWSFNNIELTLKQKWIVFLAALLTIVVCFKLHPPQAAIRNLGDVDLSRGEIAVAADQIVSKHGFDPARYRRILTCIGGTTQTEYLLENGPYERVARLFRTELPDVYWSARYFRVLEKEELYLRLDKRGRLIDWNHVVSREAPGATLSGDAALALASKTLTTEHGIDLSREKLVSQEPNRQEHRLDYRFEFERTDWHWGEARLRTAIRLKGDEPVGFHRYVKVPEAWLLDHQKSGWKKFVTGELNSWLSLAQSVLAMSLFILLIARHRVPWRHAFLIAIIPAAIGIAQFLERLPWFYSDYGTTMPLANYLTTHWLHSVLGIVLGYLGNVLSVGVALGFVRWAFGWQLKNLSFWPPTRDERSTFWTTTLLTVLTAFSLLLALSRLELLVDGFLLPTASGDFSLPPVNSAVPWFNCLLSAANDGFSRVISAATVWSVAALLYRRFARLTTIVVLLYPLLGAIQHDSWTGFLCSAVTGELRLAVTFFLVWRVFRFNAMALWLTYTFWSVICDALLFAFHGGQGYRWQSIPMLLAVALPLLVGWVMHYIARESHGTGPDDRTLVGIAISSEG